MIKLYLLERNVSVGWDEAAGFVIAARTPDRARKIANENCGDEGKLWDDSDQARITLIGTAKDQKTEKMVLQDFRAG